MRNQPPGKVSNHFEGQGTVTREMITARAREIAVINGRESTQIMDSDFEMARRELLGVESHDVSEDVPESDRWNPNPGTAGKVTQRVETDDEQTFADELVEQGAAEAEHERMIQATEEAIKRDNR